MLKMVQQEYIRFLYFQEGASIREISRRTGHHRETIRRYLRAIHPKYERQASPRYPVLGPYLHLIDNWLKNDQKVKKKQRHTARRIYQRLRDEYGFRGGESTVRDYVRRRRLELGLQEVYLPLHFRPGESIQVDWGEANVFDSSRHCENKVYMFCARLAYSTDIFIRLYPHSRMEAFLDGLRRSFEHFGGVPAEIVLDNTRTTIKRFIGWKGREETDAFLSFRTHYVVRSRFCNPRSAHEKGLVENLVGYGRRNFLVPVPSVPSVDAQGLEALNEQLLQACIAKRSMQRANSIETVGALYEEERAHLCRLPDYPYDCATRVEAYVDNCARVRFDTNLYSVPYLYAGRRIELKVYVDRIEAVVDGRVVAMHPRSYGRHGQFIELNHYLEVLIHKPGGLTHFRGWQNHRLPECYEDLLRAMLEAGRSVKEFIEILQLRRDHSDPQAVDSAVATSLIRRCPHLEAIRQLVDQVSETDINLVPAKVPEALRNHQVAPPNVTCYQQLAMREVAS
jgi:transposase